MIFCDYNCGKPATYDFVDKKGNWRYGCTTHWIEYRFSKQLGHGHGRHLGPDVEPEPRPEDQPDLDPSELARPRVSPFIASRVQSEPTKAAKIREKMQHRRLVQEFVDMEPTTDNVKVTKPGSVLYATLELCKNNDGATLDEIQAIIGSGHNALKLLEWANLNKGMGWRRDPETGKIKPVIPDGSAT